MVKNLAANAGDTGDEDLMSGSGRSPGLRNGNILQYSCLENSMDRVDFWATIHGVAKSWTRLRASVYTHTHTHTHTQSSIQSLTWVRIFCDPMDCSTPSFPVHHQLPKFTQTHVHGVSDAIQASHPLSSTSSPALNLSQHQGLFKRLSPSHKVAKALEFQLQHQSFQ